MLDDNLIMGLTALDGTEITVTYEEEITGERRGRCVVTRVNGNVESHSFFGAAESEHTARLHMIAYGNGIYRGLNMAHKRAAEAAIDEIRSE